MGRYTNYSNENQASQDPPYEFQATEEIEEESVIPHPEIDFDINHKTPIEKVEEP